MTEGVYRPPQTTKSPLCSCTAGIFCDTMLFSVAEQHRTEGAEDDTPVHQKAAFLDVLHIQCHPFVKAQLVAVRRDLPVAGKAGRGSSFILNPGCPSRCPAALSSKTAHFIIASCIPVDCKQDAEVSTDITVNVKKYRGLHFTRTGSLYCAYIRKGLIRHRYTASAPSCRPQNKRAG